MMKVAQQTRDDNHWRARFDQLVEEKVESGTDKVGARLFASAQVESEYREALPVAEWQEMRQPEREFGATLSFKTYRMPVPGGWLYRTKTELEDGAQLVFVPEPSSKGTATIPHLGKVA